MLTGTVTQCEYGQYEHGIPYWAGNTTYRRYDRWTSKKGDTGGDLLFAAYADDDSPIFNGRYDADCSCCWLNFPHTEATHAARLEKHTHA